MSKLKVLKISAYAVLVLLIYGLLLTLYRAVFIVNDYGVLCDADAWPMYYLWAAIFLSVSALVVFHLLCKRRPSCSKGLRAALISALAAVIIYSAWVIADANAMLKRTIDMFESPPYVQHVVIPQMQATSLEDLNLSIDEKRNEIIYFTRENCPSCSICSSKLKEFTEDKDIRISVYDSAVDRETREDLMSETLSRFGIETVPAILVLKNGQISERFDGENLFEEFKAYCDENM